jgi:hypothetical protein
MGLASGNVVAGEEDEQTTMRVNQELKVSATFSMFDEETTGRTRTRCFDGLECEHE